jgi:DNA primase
MALIPQPFIDSLMADVDIVSLIESDNVPLKKKGAEYRGLCPFHNDTSPSMDVNPAKGLFLCRACNETGTALDWIQLRQGTNFPESVERLASFMGRPMPTVELSKEEAAILKEKEEVYAVLDRAAKAYRAQLRHSAETIEYLKSRGVTSDVAKDFQLGFGPGQGFMQKALRDVPVPLLIKAGLLRQDEESGRITEWMANRLVFPIKNKKGKVISFAGRFMNDAFTFSNGEKPRKYLNGPETIVFKKSNEAYGADLALDSIRKKNTAVVVEGYMDVVTPFGKGFKNIVGCMGTALSEFSMRELFKSADNLVFCFDSDEAGQNAAVKAMYHALRVIDEHHTARFCFLPGKKDPDEFVRAHGADAFSQLIDNAIPLSKFLIKYHAGRVNMTEAEGRARFAVDAMADVQKIKAQFLQQVVAHEVRKTIGFEIPLVGLNAPPSVPMESLTRPTRRGFSHFHAVEEAGSAPAPKQVTLGLRVLSLLVKEPVAGNYFEPQWLNLAKTNDQEIAAVKAVVDKVKSSNGTITKEKLFEQFKGTSVGDMLHEAAQLNEGGDADVYAQLSQLVNHLSDQVSKMTVVSDTINKLRQKVSPKP